MILLGIETSCDETSVALIDDRGVVLANLISSQIERHRPFGGVVPEIASREHLDVMLPLLREALARSGRQVSDVDAIAVTAGPGLIGALLVGVAAAQGLAYSLRIPLAPVNHLDGHIFSPYLRTDGVAITRPERFWSVVVSGGHSSIYDVRPQASPMVTMLNKTRDDAAGEVLDKVAKVIGLQYPGGPEIERLARGGNGEQHRLQIARPKDDSLDFSFSGLKSMAIRLARELGIDRSENADARSDFAASFQRAVIDQIIHRLDRLWEQRPPAERPLEIALAGGVAANGLLRERVREWGESHELEVRLPEKIFCTDNAAMIAFAALNRGAEAWGDPQRVRAFSRVPGLQKGPPPKAKPSAEPHVEVNERRQ